MAALPLCSIRRLMLRTDCLDSNCENGSTSIIQICLDCSCVHNRSDVAGSISDVADVADVPDVPDVPDGVDNGVAANLNLSIGCLKGQFCDSHGQCRSHLKKFPDILVLLVLSYLSGVRQQKRTYWHTYSCYTRIKNKFRGNSPQETLQAWQHSNHCRSALRHKANDVFLWLRWCLYAVLSSYSQYYITRCFCDGKEGDQRWTCSAVSCSVTTTTTTTTDNNSSV